MDDFEQAMFIHEHMDIVKRPVDARDLAFWTEFEFLFARNVWQSRYGNCPRKWAMAKALVKIFNRLVEDRIDISALPEPAVRCNVSRISMKNTINC